MALEFNPKALGIFTNVNLGNENAIANLGDENGLKKKQRTRSPHLEDIP